jgi:undecaprenyl-diphosphatase
LLALVAALVTPRRREALFFALAIAVVAAVTSPLKETFERANVKYAFPSGHAALSAAIAAAAVVLTWQTRSRWPTLVLGTCLTAALGTALVYEDWHLPSDVLGGWCLALTCVGLLYAGFAAVARGVTD